MSKHKFVKFLPTGEMVLKYQIIGTGIWVFNAWRPAQPDDPGSTICHEAGLRWVKIGTDPDAAIYKDMKVGTPARSAAVQAAYDARYAVAHDLIFKAFGDELAAVKDGDIYDVQVSGGEVEIHPRIER